MLGYLFVHNQHNLQVLQLSVRQNSMQFSVADSSVKVWRFCDVSATDSFPIFRKCCCVGGLVLVYWCVGGLVCWCVGGLVCWCAGVLLGWCVGVLVCWWKQNGWLGVLPCALYVSSYTQHSSGHPVINCGSTKPPAHPEDGNEASS